MRALTLTAALATALAGIVACGGDDGAARTTTPPRQLAGTDAGDREARSDARPAQRSVTVATVARNLEVPWGVAFLPDGDALVAERNRGRIVRIRPGRAPRAVMRLADAYNDGGEGGLLGLAVSPRYRRDRYVYAYMTTRRDNRIVRFRLGGPVEPILTGLRRGAIHDGGGLAFGPDGKLYAGVGDVGDSSLSQDRGALNGKILRMNPDGSVPSDNPFPGSLVWSLGHRNVQGLAWDARGRMWASEFGQNRFDELNLIRKGGNYGWPVVEGRGSTDGGRFVNPVLTWRTDEASPSGLAIVGGRAYLGALRGQALLRAQLDGASARKLSPLFRGRFGRLRQLARAPDGSLWATTSNRDGRGSPRSGDDRVLRIRLGSTR